MSLQGMQIEIRTIKPCISSLLGSEANDLLHSNIFLMGPGQNDEIELQIPPETETIQLISQRMIPVRGYTRGVLAGLQEGRNRYKTFTVDAQKEISCYAVALALESCENLFSSPPNTRSHETFSRASKIPVCEEARLVFEAARLLLDDHYDLEIIQDAYQALHIHGFLKMPLISTLEHVKRMKEDWRPTWARQKTAIDTLAQVILSFAAVGDLSTCEDLAIGDVFRSSGLKSLSKISPRHIDKPNYWFWILSDLLCGREESSSKLWCLISRKGWSLFKDTLRSRDPEDSRHARIWIQRGVPTYSGGTTRYIKDGPTNFGVQARPMQTSRPRPAEIGQRTKAVSQINTQLSKPHMNTSGDCWHFNHRIWQGQPDCVSVSVGCSLLYRSLEVVKHIGSCRHSNGFARKEEDHKAHDSFLLSAEMFFVTGFRYVKRPAGRVLIAHTYQNAAARWLALVGLREWRSGRIPVLRHSSACVDCFVREACQIDDDRRGLYLIL